MMSPIALLKLQRRLKPEDPRDEMGYENDHEFAPDSGDPTDGEVSPTEEPDLESLLKEGPALSDYKSGLKNRPDRKDYKPSTGRRIAAALLAGAQGYTSGADKGIALGESIKNRPFNEAQDDWSRKQKNLGEVAALEEKDQGRKLNIFGMKERSRHNQESEAAVLDKIQAQGEIAAAKNENDALKREFAKTKADLDRAEREGNHKDMVLLHTRLAEIAQQNADSNTKNASTKEKGAGAQDKRLGLTARKAYEAEMKPIRDADASYASIQNLAKEATGPADVAMLMSFVHSIDQTAAREGEVRTAQSAQSLGNRISAYMQNLKTGRKLDPKAVQEFVNAAKQLHDSYWAPRKRQIQDNYGQMADDWGIDRKHIMSDSEKKGELSEEAKRYLGL